MLTASALTNTSDSALDAFGGPAPDPSASSAQGGAAARTSGLVPPMNAPGAASTGRGLLDGMAEMLSDPKGFADRQRARRKLAGLFDIVPEDHAGPRLPNQITRAEYDRVVQTYSDIQLGRGDLTIDTAEMDKTRAETYREQVMANVAMMMQTESGRRQIYGLHDNVLRDDAGQALDADGNVAARREDEAHRHVTIWANYGMAANPATGEPMVGRDVRAASTPSIDANVSAA
jgi:hypothetical protein